MDHKREHQAPPTSKGHGSGYATTKDATLWNASFELTLFGCVIYICCVGFASLDVVCDKLK